MLPPTPTPIPPEVVVQMVVNTWPQWLFVLICAIGAYAYYRYESRAFRIRLGLPPDPPKKEKK